MNLWDKELERWMEVYDISYDKKGYPHFLVYYDGQWIRRSAKCFTPNAPWDEEGKGLT